MSQQEGIKEKENVLVKASGDVQDNPEFLDWLDVQCKKYFVVILIYDSHSQKALKH